MKFDEMTEAKKAQVTFDYIDIHGDGDKKEPMKKAVKDKEAKKIKKKRMAEIKRKKNSKLEKKAIASLEKAWKMNDANEDDLRNPPDWYWYT